MFYCIIYPLNNYYENNCFIVMVVVNEEMVNAKAEGPVVRP